MKRMIKYPSIEQYRTVVKNIQHMSSFIGQDENGEPIFDRSQPKPTLTVIASEKIHGTNASICYSGPDGFWVQGRNRIITPEDDNAGCAFIAEQNKDAWLKIIKTLIKEYNIDIRQNIITVYYEWAGGNIQKNSALSGLEKTAIIFQYFKVSPIEPDENKSSKWYNTMLLDEPTANIYNIMNFNQYKFEVDFNNPEPSQNEFIKVMGEVENNSPVGKTLGKDGNIGEGIVCTLWYKGALMMFKCKGEKHSKSPVKKLKEVDLEELKAIDKCIEKITHNWRFEQGLVEVFGSDYENNIDRRKMGDYLKWVGQDTIKEESDIIAECGFEPKQVMSKVNQKAKEYFMALEKL